MGSVRLTGLTPAWAEILALGRFLHAGSLPALEAALDHLAGAGGGPDQDGVTADELRAAGDPALEALSRELRDGTYRPPSLKGQLRRRDDGRLRPLAVPTMRDRTAQRAAAQALGPAVDALLEDCSYAYRKGFSRAGAARAIQRAWDEGFRVVLDADIESFFDSVDLERLGAKLRALFPWEPLVDLVSAWMRAPVVFDGELVQRRRGLPQGAPLSPLLANLYLDELDEEILGQGFRLVRFADDFVVLCKSAEEAERARAAARASLADLGLALNEEKTAIRHLDEGLTYLGYLFCRSLVLEPEKPPVPPEPPPPLTAESIPAASWLAQVPLHRLRALVAREEKAEPRRRRLEILPLAAPDTRLVSTRRPLYVLRWDAQLKVAGGTLRIEWPREGGGEEDVLEAPLEGLSHMVFVGRSRVTMPALLALARKGVPAYFTSPAGRLEATFAPADPDWTLWQAQAAFAAAPARVTAFAREVVAAKLTNAAVLAVRFKLQGHGEAGAELRELAREALNKTDLEVLRGLEGRGAALFLRALAGSLPEAWGFAGRKRQPPPDPVNAMLSFGYTLLYHHAATALSAAGLNPQVGLFHAGRGRHQALASDLVEELRFLVDGLVVTLVRRRELAPEDFVRPSPDSAAVLLSRLARKRFVERFEERLSTLFAPEEGEERLTYWQFLSRQAGQLRQLVRGEATLYRPLRLRE